MTAQTRDALLPFTENAPLFGLAAASEAALSLFARALLQPRPDSAAIARAVALDPCLAAFVLHQAHLSADAPAHDIPSAVLALGARGLTAALLTFADRPRPRSRFGTDARQETGPDLEQRLTSVARAIAAEEIARRITPAHSAEAHLVALLAGVAPLLAPCLPPDALTGNRLGARPLLPPGDYAARLFAAWGWPEDMQSAVLAACGHPGEDAGSPLVRAVLLGSALAGARKEGAKERLAAALASEPEFSPPRFSLEEAAFVADQWEKRFAAASMLLGGAEEPFFAHTLPRLRRLHALARGLCPERGGFPALARNVGNQIGRFWGMEHWELSLRLPGNRLFLFARAENGARPAVSGPYSASGLPWNPGLERYGLVGSHGLIGQLRTAPPGGKPGDEPGMLPDMAEFSLYLLLACRELEHWLRNEAATENRAASFAALPLGIARIDAEGRFLDANPAFLAFFGLEQLPKAGLAELLHIRFGISPGAAWKRFVADDSGGRGQSIVMPAPATRGGGPGTPPPALLRLRLLSGASEPGRHGAAGHAGAYPGYLVSLEEVPSSEPVRDSGQAEKLLAASPDTLLLLDAAGTVLWGSGRAATLAGEDFFRLASPFSSFFQDEWGPGFLASLTRTTLVEAVLAPHGENGEGGGIWSFSFSPFSDASVPGGCIATGRPMTYDDPPDAGPDVSDTPSLPRTDSSAALYPGPRDALTGLFSYSQCHAILERESEMEYDPDKGVGILFLDMDAFHLVNDIYGYQTGDVILRRAAASVRASLRPGLDFACRYSGDDFVVVMTRADEASVEKAAQTVRRAVERNCRDAVAVNCGMALIRPGMPYQQRLAGAKRACREAAIRETRCQWAAETPE